VIGVRRHSLPPGAPEGGGSARSLSSAAAAERLGFLGQAGLHLTTLGRVEQRAGDNKAAVDTLNRAIDAAKASGDHRIAATARVHLARILRAEGAQDTARALLEQNDRWYRATGGGEGALLTRCLLAALPSGADRADRTVLLEAVLDGARGADNREVHVLASDALARLAAEQGRFDTARRLLRSGDDLISQIHHVLDDVDRIDAHQARVLVAENPTGYG
jgi:ATP/maltotriose-dependent transcriptional regulator MalT